MPDENQTPSQEGASGGGPLARFLAMPNETPQKMLIVTITLCVVCAIVVSLAAVALKPRQEINAILEEQRNILSAAGLLRPGADVQELFRNNLEVRVVDLDTGEYVGMEDPLEFDQRRAAQDPARSTDLTREEDIAGIGRRENRATVYLAREDGKLSKVILPVRGYGLWSTMKGFIALEEDTKTVAGLTFHEHAETPGLGGEISNPSWQAQWDGKEIYGEQWEPRIELVKGSVDPNAPDAEHKVDALAGATLTSRGVENLMHFWLGENGFGPYLAKLRQEREKSG